MNLEFLALTKNNKKVFYDPIHSHAATHLEDTPQLKSLVIEALPDIILDDGYREFEELEVDMGRVIGNTDGVDIDPGDKLVWAKRKNRDNYTVFNKSKSPRPSTFITMSFSRPANNSYILETAYISDGQGYSPPFPGDPNETPDSKEYWSKHALAWGTQEIQEGTLIEKCPW